ncbi:L,D-transpeptidase family protein [Streptomyces sp. DH12]|uniref:L,D-transpeptidase family protein n=1 Tax=Streptomyces sp. DH12 TaxID=2857010 RepID=UPI001E55959C|nr:L,D-transpeptidase family protein [Streptomyces sp. DH12]
MNMYAGSSVRRSLRTISAAGAAVVAVGLLPASATAQAAAPAAAPTTAAAKSYTYLSFKKNAHDPSNSRLHLVYVQQVNADKTRSYVVDSWRAGSGIGDAKNKAGRNACKRNQGWLPNGTYQIKAFHNNYAGRINGIVWHLSNKKCSNGTPRTELFIHSEMKSNGKQGSTEPTRWDGNGDYKSEGCIKLKPSDVRELKGYRSNYPKPTKLYVS